MFRTELIPRPAKEKIRIGDKIYLIGSCFADHIGNLLKVHKFNTLLNPFGVIYNPYSILKAMVDSLTGQELDEKGLFENQGIYRHFDFHSDISAGSKEEFYSLFKSASTASGDFLKNTEWLIISMGTSIVYEHRTYQKIVSNCHKLPGRQFDQRMLTPEEMITSFDSFYKQIREVNEKISIILTVSPVRHIKSTIEKNSQSKAILRYVAGTLSDKFDKVQYFPSFEMMMDDLRDYRFYRADMIHPNEVAIDYIWKKFTDTYLDGEAKDFIHEWVHILKAMDHKPFYPGSVAHQRFIKETIKKLRTFEPRIDIGEELVTLENQLL